MDLEIRSWKSNLGGISCLSTPVNHSRWFSGRLSANETWRWNHASAERDIHFTVLLLFIVVGLPFPHKVAVTAHECSPARSTAVYVILTHFDSQWPIMLPCSSAEMSFLHAFNEWYFYMCVEILQSVLSVSCRICVVTGYRRLQCCPRWCLQMSCLIRPSIWTPNILILLTRWKDSFLAHGCSHVAAATVCHILFALYLHVELQRGWCWTVFFTFRLLQWGKTTRNDEERLHFCF